MPQFIDSIEYTDTEGGKVTLDGITNISTVDASTLSVASAQEAQHAVNADNATNANHATSADSATNVTTNINGSAISSIFESDGTTVKNATKTGFTNGAKFVPDEGDHRIPNEDALYFVEFPYGRIVARGFIRTQKITDSNKNKYVSAGDIIVASWSSGDFQGNIIEFFTIVQESEPALEAGQCYLEGNISDDFNLWDNISSVTLTRIQ